MKLKITLVTLFIGLLTFAQGARKEKVKALKIAFITEQIDLTTKEAQAFWPIYNNFSDSMETVFRSERKLLRDLREGYDTMSDQEAQKGLDDLFAYEQQRLDAKRNLKKLLQGVISNKKVITLFKAEEDFKRRLLRELRDRKPNRRNIP